MLVVVAIIAVMMSLLVPAIGGFTNTAGRRGAVNVVMNTLEQARVAALESGQTVYVGFADRDFSPEMQYTALIVFREATAEEKADPSNPRTFVVLKRWTRLPKNIAFKNVANSLIGSSEVKKTFSGLASQLGSGQSRESFPYLAFNSSGAVEEPSGNLRLYLYEGYFAENQDKPTRNQNGGLFEQISISRYTGRVQLDITATGT